jgi:hypothetical protein
MFREVGLGGAIVVLPTGEARPSLRCLGLMSPIGMPAMQGHSWRPRGRPPRPTRTMNGTQTHGTTHRSQRFAGRVYDA